MARYRKISTSMHADERYRKLSAPLPNARSLWVELLTGPRTTSLPGVVIARPAAIAADLQWNDDGPEEMKLRYRKGFGKPLRKGFDESFQELLDANMVKADPEAGLIWLPKAIYHNRPNNPNVIKGWSTIWPDVPECVLKNEIKASLAAFMAAIDAEPKHVASKPFGKALAKSFREPFGDGSPIQEQEQEQEQEELYIKSPVADSRASAPVRPEPDPNEPPPASDPPPWMAAGSSSPVRDNRRREPSAYPQRAGPIPGSTPRDPCRGCGRRDGTLTAYNGPSDLLCPACLDARRAKDRPHTLESKTAADALAEYRARLGRSAKPPEDAK